MRVSHKGIKHKSFMELFCVFCVLVAKTFSLVSGPGCRLEHHLVGVAPAPIFAGLD